MAFDPTTAKPVSAPVTSGFDPSTAKPVGGASGVQRFVNNVSNAAANASLNGFGGLVARKYFEVARPGIDTLKKANPGQTDQWYNDRYKQLINESVTEERTRTAQATKDNSFNIPGTKIDPVAFGAGIVGGADPTYLIPGGNLAGAGLKRLAAKGIGGAVVKRAAETAAAKTLGGAATRVASNAALQAGLGSATDAAYQGADIADKLQDKFDVKRNLLSAAAQGTFGAGLQGAEEVGGWLRKAKTPEVNAPDAAPVAERPPVDVNDPEYLRSRVADHLEAQMDGWKNKPDIEVHMSQDEVPAGVPDDALGFYNADTGKVHILADRIETPEQMNAVLFHESLGHYGLAQQFGSRLDTTLKNLLKRNVGQFGRDVATWQTDNPGAYGGDRLRAAEEVLANKSNNGELKPVLMDAIVSNVRTFGRKLGLKLSYSDAEVNNILSMAHSAVVNGKGRDVRGNGFRFMFTGPNAKTFDPNSATAYKAKDGIVRNEISDENAKLNFPEGEPTGDYKLGDVLDHPELYKAYPELRDLSISHKPIVDYQGQYHEANDMFKPKMDVNSYGDNKLATVLHETQHAVQDIEQYPDFVAGDSQHLQDKDYLSHPSEREAFTTEARREMTPEERLSAPTPRFMRKGDFEPKDVAEEAYERLGKNYVPKYRSWEDANKAAIERGIDPEAIKKLRSAGDLDKKLFIYDEAATEINGKLNELAQKAESETGLSADDFQEGIGLAAQFNYVLGRIERDANQIGRALNAMKAIQFSRNNILKLREELQKGDTNLDALTDEDTMLKFLKQFQSLQGNPAGQSKLVKGVIKPYWWQYALSWRNNMMLSGLSTHLKVSMDTATNAGREIEEKLSSLPLSVVRDVARSLGFKNVKQGVSTEEIAMHLWGMSRAVLDAQTYKNMKTAFKGAPQTRFSGTGIQNPRIPGVSKITDAIAAQDAFYRSVLENANLYALGTRKAKEDGIKGWDNITTAGSGHANNPTLEMVHQAEELAANTMLTNQSPMNSELDRAKRIEAGLGPWSQATKFGLNYMAPFVRTQSNALMNQIIRRSPLSFLDPVTKADWAAGGARRDVAIMRTIIGTTVIVNAWNAAGKDDSKLTGPGPVGNTSKIKELEASGWRPDSVHGGGKYTQNSNLNLSINPFSLSNNVAKLVAGVRHAWDEGASANDTVLGIKMAMHASLQALNDQTFMNDITDTWQSLTQPGETGLQKMGRAVGNELSSFLPNAMRQATKVIDPVSRDTSDGIVDQLKSSVPGLSDDLPARHTSYGSEMQTGKSLTGLHTTQQEVTDPAEAEMARLAKLTKAAIVTPVLRTIDIPDTGLSVKLNAKQFQEYQQYSGATITQAVRSMQESGQWDQLSDQDKVRTIRDVQTDAKKLVRETLIQKEGWLTDKQLSELRGQQNGN